MVALSDQGHVNIHTGKKKGKLKLPVEMDRVHKIHISYSYKKLINYSNELLNYITFMAL